MSKPCLRALLFRAVSPLALLMTAAPGWANSAEGDGGVSELPPVTVSAPAAATDGSAQSGYIVQKADMGPLGDKSILDTPYSVVPIPLDLMVAQQAANISDIIKYDPSAQIEPRGNLDFGRPQTRGFENASTQNTRIDGMNSYTIMAYPMEAFQSLEILNGAAGGIYGASSPGGRSISSASVRPTSRWPRRPSVTTATACSPNTSRRAATSPTARSAIGSTRFNGQGQSYVAGSNIERDLVSGNFDVRLNDHTKLEVNAYSYEDKELGLPSAFVYGANPGKGLPFAPALTNYLPAAPNPATEGYGVLGAGQTLSAGVVDARLIHDFSPDWKLTVGGLYQTVDRTENPTGTYGAADPGNWLTNANGDYSVIVGDTALKQQVTFHRQSQRPLHHRRLDARRRHRRQRLPADRRHPDRPELSPGNRLDRQSRRLFPAQLRQPRFVLPVRHLRAGRDGRRRHDHLQRALAARRARQRDEADQPEF